MQKTLTRLFTAVLMAALLVSASIMSVFAAEVDCNEHADGWTAITAAQTLSTEGGKYYLNADVTGAITVSAKNVVLCLNGQKLSNAGATALTVSKDASLTLCNCAKDEGVVSGGLLTSDSVDTRYTIINGGTLTMETGVVIEAGCRGVKQNATFTMNGGTIRPASSTKGAYRGIYAAGGTTNMNGGKISGFNATEAGCAIYGEKTATINLNGGEITGNTTASSGTVFAKGTVNLYEGASISGNTAANGGGVALGLLKTTEPTQDAPGTLNLRGGTISNNTATSMGGGVYVEYGTANVYSGTISDNTAPYGAGVQLAKSSGPKASMTMEGGSITGNTVTHASDNGGAVCLFSDSSFTMNDGSITDNKKGTSCGTNAGVHVGNSAFFTMNGGEISGNDGGGITNKAKVLTITGGSVDKFSAGTTTVITGGKFISDNYSAETLGNYIDKSNYEVKAITGSAPYDLEVVEKEVELGDCSPGDHSHWTPIKNAENAYITTAGKYVLGEELTVDDGSSATSSQSSCIVINAGLGNHVTVCLNGMDITPAGLDNAFYVLSGTVTLCNCSETTSVLTSGAKRVLICGNSYPSGDLDSVLTIQGNIHLTSADTSPSENLAQVGSDGHMTMKDGVKISAKEGTKLSTKGGVVQLLGEFDMEGGEISNNVIENSTGVNAIVYLNKADIAKFDMSGGKISYNKVSATNCDAVTAGVYVVGGTFTMTGGEISHNKATLTSTNSSSRKIGGGMFISGGAHALQGGSVHHNTATLNWTYQSDSDMNSYAGGGVFVGAGTTNLTGTELYCNTVSNVTKSTSTSKSAYAMAGGAVCIAGGTVNVDGSVISGNSGYALGSASGKDSSNNGRGAGAIYNHGTLNIKSGTIGGTPIESAEDCAKGTGNYATTRGGAVASFNALNITGGTITGNYAGGEGGALYLFGSKTYVIDGAEVKIENNAAKDKGGAVLIYSSNSTLELRAGTISNNSAPFASGVHVLAGKFVMNGGLISEHSGQYGAAVLVESANTFTMNGGVISGNKITGGAGNGGAVCLFSTSTFTMNGGEIKDNAITDGYASNAPAFGGAIYVGTKASFIMNAGSISGSTGENGAATTGVGINLNSDKTYQGKVEINGGSINDIIRTDTAKLTVYGGKFSTNVANRIAAKNGEMLSLVKISDSGLKYEVRRGFNSKGEFMDFQSSLAFSLYLNADVNFTSEGHEGYAVSAVSANKTYPAVLTVDEVTGNLMITASGIAAKEMQDAITFTVKDGETVLFTKTVSVYDAAQEWASDNKPADDILVADMINYGAAAQEAFDYGVGKTMEGGTVGDVVGEWNTADADVTEGFEDMIAVSLNLKERIELNVYVNSANVQIAESDAYTVTTTANGITRITFDTINVKDVKTPIELTFTVEGEPVTVKYSVEAYVAAALAMGGQDDLMTALQKYVDSVSAYLPTNAQ